MATRSDATAPLDWTAVTPAWFRLRRCCTYYRIAIRPQAFGLLVGLQLFSSTYSHFGYMSDARQCVPGIRFCLWDSYLLVDSALGGRTLRQLHASQSR